MARSEGYSTQQIALHWAVVLLVAVQFIGHEGMVRAFEAGLETGIAEATALAGLHIFCGFSIFVLMLARLGLRQSHGTPPPVAGEPAWAAKAGRAAHWGFYALLLALPVSGAVAWFRQSAGAADLHGVLRAALFALILAHVAAALLHRFVWKTDAVARMVPARHRSGTGGP